MLPVRPSNNDLGDLYGLYKQATVGDVNIGESVTCKRGEFAKLNPAKRVLSSPPLLKMYRAYKTGGGAWEQ